MSLMRRMNKVTDKTELCGKPSSSGKEEDRTNTNSKSRILEKANNKQWEVTTQATLMEVSENAISPRTIIGFLWIKGNTNQVLTPNKSFTYGSLKAKWSTDERWSRMPHWWGDKILLLSKNHIRRGLTIRSESLHEQLVKSVSADNYTSCQNYVKMLKK